MSNTTEEPTKNKKGRKSNKNKPKIFKGGLTFNTARVRTLIKNETDSKMQSEYPIHLSGLLQTVVREFAKESRSRFEKDGFTKVILNTGCVHSILNTYDPLKRLNLEIPLIEVRKSKRASIVKKHRNEKVVEPVG